MLPLSVRGMRGMLESLSLYTVSVYYTMDCHCHITIYAHARDGHLRAWNIDYPRIQIVALPAPVRALWV